MFKDAPAHPRLGYRGLVHRWLAPGCSWLRQLQQFEVHANHCHDSGQPGTNYPLHGIADHGGGAHYRAGQAGRLYDGSAARCQTSPVGLRSYSVN